jgi:stage V sporulation protein T
MKATGIVRRIDDLGRVVIPKEVRRTMGIREGDPLEIYTGERGEVIFKKYTPCTEKECGAILKGLYRSVCLNAAGRAAVYGTDDNVICRSCQALPIVLTDRADECSELKDYKVYTIRGLEDVLGFLVVERDNNLIRTVVANTEAILRELEY